MRRTTMSVVVAVLLGGFTVAAAQLPPEIMADRLMAEEDHEAALDEMNQIVALQGHVLKCGPRSWHTKRASRLLMVSGRTSWSRASSIGRF